MFCCFLGLFPEQVPKRFGRLSHDFPPFRFRWKLVYCRICISGQDTAFGNQVSRSLAQLSKDLSHILSDRTQYRQLYPGEEHYTGHQRRPSRYGLSRENRRYRIDPIPEGEEGEENPQSPKASRRGFILNEVIPLLARLSIFQIPYLVSPKFLASSL